MIYESLKMETDKQSCNLEIQDKQSCNLEMQEPVWPAEEVIGKHLLV